MGHAPHCAQDSTPVRMRATSWRSTPGGAVDIKRVTRGDWVVVAGFVALLIGTSLSWYALVALYSEVTLRFGVSGWAYPAGWLSWLAGLAALVVIILS